MLIKVGDFDLHKGTNEVIIREKLTGFNLNLNLKARHLTSQEMDECYRLFRNLSDMMKERNISTPKDAQDYINEYEQGKGYYINTGLIV